MSNSIAVSVDGSCGPIISHKVVDGGILPITISMSTTQTLNSEVRAAESLFLENRVAPKKHPKCLLRSSILVWKTVGDKASCIPICLVNVLPTEREQSLK